MKPLGPVEKTDRGFEIIKFRDRYDEPCSLQQSSLAEYTLPGSSAVWLGLDLSVLHETKSGRMHLDREQVWYLVHHLQRWLNTGSFILKPIEVGDRIRFLKTLEDGPSEEHPAIVYATKGETGQVTKVGGCKEGFWVKTDRWDVPFGCESSDFDVI